MLREETDFIGDAIGIDPTDCGCTDCIVGNSIPLGEIHLIEELVRAHFEEDRKVIFRCGGAIVMYRSRYGEYKWEPLYSEALLQHDVISPEQHEFDYMVGEGTLVIEDTFPVPEGSVDVGDRQGMEALVEKHFIEGEIIINRTKETLVVYRTAYREFRHVSINADDDEPVVSVVVD
jgi:hypothetical protein